MITLKNVSKYYKTEAGVSVGLYKANLELELGEFIAIVGESGSGKSTLLNVISGLDSYEEGEMLINNEPTSHYEIADWEQYRKTNVGFVFQNYNIIDSYTVLQNVMLALEFQGYPKDKMKSRALELIEQVGLTHRKNSKTARLSGGEKQRTVIARALAKDCPVIVCDEPTGNLDSESGAKIMKLLHDISKEKLVIVVSHNYDEVAPYATRRIKLHDGSIVEDAKLKPHDKVDKIIEPKTNQLSKWEVIKWSFKDLLTKPNRLLFLVMANLVVMLLFSINFGATQKTLNTFNFGETPFYSAHGPIDGQLLLSRHDRKELTDEEINKLVNNPSLVTYKTSSLYLLYNVSLELYHGEDVKYLRTFGVGDSTIFEKSKFLLSSGEAPSNINEIVLSQVYASNFDIGEEVIIKSSDSSFYSQFYKFPEIPVKVVGFSSAVSEIIYFHKDFFNKGNLGYNLFMISAVSAVSLTRDLVEKMPNELKIDGTGTIGANEIHINSYLYDDTLDGYMLADPYFEYYNVDADGITIVNNDDHYMPTISLEMAREIADVAASKKYQLLLNFKDQVDANKYKNSVDSSVYAVNVKYTPATTINKILAEIVTILAYIGIFIQVLFLYAILGLVIRNSMSTRKKDFAIFRSIGANQKEIGLLVIIQQVIISIISFVLLLVLLIIIGKFVPIIYIDLRFLYWYHYIILFMAFIFFSMWLGFRFNRRIFEITVVKNLSLEEEI